MSEEIARAVGDAAHAERQTAEIAAMRQMMARAAGRLLADDVPGAIEELEGANTTAAGVALLQRHREMEDAIERTIGDCPYCRAGVCAAAAHVWLKQSIGRVTP